MNAMHPGSDDEEVENFFQSKRNLSIGMMELCYSFKYDLVDKYQ